MTTARLKADLYALTHRGTPGDAAYYARVCTGARSVLELGSGYARLLSVLAQPRRTVTGLDLDPELLAAAKRAARKLPVAKRQAIRLVQGDMRRFELGRRFDCVLLPYNGVYCLLTKRDALTCFRAARAALVPGGAFAFDVWNAAQFHREAAAHPSAGDPEPIVSLRHAGCIWDVFERSRVRRAAQRLDVTYDYVARENGVACRIVIPQRYYLAAELGDLLRRAGFVVERRYGDFSEARFTSRSEQLIVIARAV